MSKKVLIIGWDCATPQLLFDRFRDELPHVKQIMGEGVWGKLKSVTPPITIPAWRCMVTGKTPGELGLYGFRQRKNNSYRNFSITTSLNLSKDAIWDIIGKTGKKSLCSAIPPSFPPYEINGNLIGCFMTPDMNKTFTYPESLSGEIKDIAPGYAADTQFRVEDKKGIKESAFKMTGAHFDVLEELLQKKEWQFAMHVEIGLDRIQHAFWRYMDENHHLYEPDSEFKNVIKDYYKLLDRRLGHIMDIIDNDTLLIVASDHGAKAMKGAFCVNQWLNDIGYLKFKNKERKKGLRIQDAEINWKKTKAWGWGGYYSRIFFNIKGREKRGKIKPAKLQKEIKKLRKKIKKVKGPQGQKWNTKVFTPDELFSPAGGEKPDLMVFWDDLSWRAAGTLGHDNIYLEENDTGPDDGVHDWNGIIMGWKKGLKKGIITENARLLDIHPTVLKYLGYEPADNLKGKVIGKFIDE